MRKKGKQFGKRLMNWIEYSGYEPSGYEKTAAHRLVYEMGYDFAYVKLQKGNQSISISVKKGQDEFFVWCRAIKQIGNDNSIPAIFENCICLMGGEQKYITSDSLSDFFKKHGYGILKMSATSDEVIQGFIRDGSMRFAVKYVSTRLMAEHEREMSTDVLHEESAVIKDFDNMEGHEFEKYCAFILEKNGFRDVTVTSGSGDQGIDITAEKEGVKYGIQCKCYSQDIGNRAVQEVYAGKAFYKCHVGIVLTNRYFTKSAKELAENNGIILWDRDKLISLLDSKKELRS